MGQRRILFGKRKVRFEFSECGKGYSVKKNVPKLIFYTGADYNNYNAKSL